MKKTIAGVVARARQQYLVLIALAIVVLLYAVLFSWSGSGFWRWDDATILRHLQSYGIWSNLIAPEVWQSFSSANLTPWILISYQFDLALFGLQPSAFYLHQVLAILMCGLALYLLLGVWIGRGFALFGSVLFLLGTPPVILSQMLMTRHYLEGLAFGLFSLLFFIKYLRSPKFPVLLISTLFYVLAILAKEIYVPLAVLFPFLPEGERKLRLFASLPAIVIVALYSIWRGYLLGVLLGGYEAGPSYTDPSFIGDVLSSFSRFPLLLFGPAWPLTVLLCLSLVFLYPGWNRQALLVSALLLALILLPLIPLVRNPGIVSADRYLLLPWAVCCFGIAYFSSHIGRRFQELHPRLIATSIAIAALGIVIITASNTQTWFNRVMETAAEYDVQGKFMWNNSSELAFTPTPTVSEAYWYAADLEEVKHLALPDKGFPRLIPDALFLDAGIQTLYAYDRTCRCMSNVSDSIDSLRRQLRDNVRPVAPLQVRFDYTDGIMNWQFGPYRQGAYRVLYGEAGSIPVPPSGAVRIRLFANAAVFVRYESPEGWVTYSDELTLGTATPEVDWRRQ